MVRLAAVLVLLGVAWAAWSHDPSPCELVGAERDALMHQQRQVTAQVAALNRVPDTRLAAGSLDFQRALVAIRVERLDSDLAERCR